MSETFIPLPPLPETTIPTDADILEDIPGPVLREVTLAERVDRYRSSLDRLKGFYATAAENPEAVTDEVKTEASETLHDAAARLTGIVVASERDGDRETIRAVVLGLLDTREDILNIRRQQNLRTELVAYKAWEEAFDSLSHGLRLGDFAYPKGYLDHEAGSVFSEAEEKRIFSMCLDFQGRRDIYKELEYFTRIRSWEFLKADGAYNEMYGDPRFVTLVGRMAAEDTRKGGLSSHKHEMVNKTFRKLGFSEDERWDVIHRWWSYDKHKGDDDRRESVSSRYETGFRVISQLMRTDPEAPHDLYTKFGIRNFYRYWNWVSYLSDQWKNERAKSGAQPGETPEPKKSAVLVVSAADDWNGALDNQDAAEFDMRPVFAEAATIGEVGKVLARTKKIYGPLRSLVINGHGNSEGILLSRRGDGNDGLSTKDVLKSKGISRLRSKKYFLDGAKIFLFSCSTGKKESIGEALAIKSQTEVVAPRVNGHTTFEPDYRRGHNPAKPRYVIDSNKGEFYSEDNRRLNWFLKRRNYVNVHISPDGKRRRAKSFSLPE